MLTPGYAISWLHYYPLGNTPAVRLTQSLPAERKANVLLLGCGDVRNLLFTVHSDGKLVYSFRVSDQLESLTETRRPSNGCDEL